MTMFRKMLLFLLMILLPALAHARNFNASQSSGEQTTDQAIVDGACWITAVEVITDGSNDGKVVLYDNASAASGKVVLEITILGASNFGGRVWDHPVQMFNGIYVDVTGTGASYIIEYIK